jgi:hypothetical protein
LYWNVGNSHLRCAKSQTVIQLRKPEITYSNVVCRLLVCFNVLLRIAVRYSWLLYTAFGKSLCN